MHKIRVDSLDSTNEEIKSLKPMAYSEDYPDLSDFQLVHKKFLSDLVNLALSNYALLPDRVLSGLQYSRVGDDVTITAGTWGGTTIFTIPDDTQFLNIPLSAAGLQRYIRFYATEDETVLKIEGAESSFAELPDLPANTLGLKYVLISDAVIGDPEEDLTGFELLANKSTSVETDKLSTDKYPHTKATYDFVVEKLADFVFSEISTTTTALTLAALNTTYATLPIKGEVICADITDGPTIYKKITASTWCQIPISIVE